MESQSVNEKSIGIKFQTPLIKPFSKIREDLYAVYGETCLSNGAISKWINCFKDDRKTTKDDKHKG